MRKRALLGVAVAAGWLMCVCGVSQGAAQGRPLPRLPKLVWELFLPEEYDGCGVMYGIYARLPEAERGRLHAGEKVYVDPSGLSGDAAAKIATWFNSARWGCDPLAEKLDANAVRSATIVLKCEDSVVEFCLRSLEKRIWKKLTIACAPERAEWVRDGLPFLPAWIAVAWSGGAKPPEPPAAYVTKWQWMQWLYGCYAELPAPVLRDLHQKGTLRVSIRDISKGARSALASVIDSYRRGRNEQEGKPLNYGRPADARRRVFGIEEIVLRYSRSHPDCVYNFPFGNNAYECPRSSKQIYVTANPSYPLPPQDWFIGRDETGRYAQSLTFLVAMEAPLQRKVVRWRSECDAWVERWQYEEGGRQYVREGAPPYPTLR